MLSIVLLCEIVKFKDRKTLTKILVKIRVFVKHFETSPLSLTQFDNEVKFSKAISC